MSWIRTRRRLLAITAVVGCSVLGFATPAFAHASVVSSFPAQGQHVPHDPATVTIVFDQPVKPDDGGLLVLDSSGAKVSTASGHPRPDTLTASLPTTLGQGAFVANYTVTSVDGHIVSGGIVFLVGNASTKDIGALTRSTPSFPKAVDDFGQFLVYLGVLAAAGIAFFMAFVLRSGRERSLLRQWTIGFAACGVVGMLLTIAGQAASEAGGFNDLGNWSYLSQTLTGSFGAQSAVQILGLASCIASFSLRVPVYRQFAAFYGLLSSAGAFVIFGHAVASPYEWATVPADVVHVIVAALWFGGLLGLTFVLRSRFKAVALLRSRSLRSYEEDTHVPSHRNGALGVPDGSGTRSSTAVLERAPERTVTKGGYGDSNELRIRILQATAELVGRFSTMAATSVCILIVAGVVLSIALVGSVRNLVETGYGQLLMIKIAVVGVVLLMALYNRSILLPFLFARSKSGADESETTWGWYRLKGTLRVEALGVVAVLFVTAILANGTPSNKAPAPSPVAFSQSQAFNGGRVTLKITPNQALVNDFVVQFTGVDGVPESMAESVSVYLVLPSENVGPIETDMKPAGVGRYVLSDSPYPPIVGTWQIVLQVQVSEFSQPNISFTDQVR